MFLKFKGTVIFVQVSKKKEYVNLLFPLFLKKAILSFVPAKITRLSNPFLLNSGINVFDFVLTYPLSKRSSNTSQNLWERFCSPPIR